MSKSKKLITLALSVLLSAFVFMGCGGEDANPNPANQTEENQNIPADKADENQTAADARIPTDLPAADFDGYEFTVMSRSEQYNSYWYARDISVEEESGDALDDSIYRRNKRIEEDYNMAVKELALGGNFYTTAKKSIAAGDDAYDLFCVSIGEIGTALAQDGLLYDICEMPHVNLERPWWDPKAKTELKLAGKLYFTMSDLTFVDKDATWIMLFNKDLIQSLGLENPYKLVEENRWTFDKLIEMMKAAPADLNGDGIWDEFDRYGLVSQKGTNGSAFFSGAGESIITLDREGMPQVSVMNDRAVDVFVKIVEIQSMKYVTIHADDYTSKYADVWDDMQLRVFAEDRGLFYYTNTLRITSLRSRETNFGILPCPKYEASQPEYHHLVDPWCATNIAVPANASDIGRTGIILEALTAESHYGVIPAYYEINLKTKLSRDDESKGMLDLIFSTRRFDYGVIYDWGAMRSIFDTLPPKGDTGFVSAYEKKLPALEKAMAKTISAFLGD